ncbi:MFS transporter [Marinomonas posidonica]|uniref:MFS transporter n=1 Tax=Marinomonas posidonica TaxID=936476 RepID=UPI0037367AD3
MRTEPTILNRAGLIILMAGQLLPLIDFSIVNVALSAIAQSLNASHLQLELMVAAYGIGLAVCLAMGSRLGDNFGRRRLFTLGVWVFGLASLACGISSSINGLLFARVIQGVGAAMILPQILATLHVNLSGKRHSFAIGAYGAIGGMAFVLGQILGGFLVSANVAGLGWRSVFLINIPVCIGVLLFVKHCVPESRSEHPATVDWAGTLLLAIALLCLLIPVALGPEYHWSWPFIVMLFCVVPLSLVLWKVEKHKENGGVFPLMPPRLLRLPSIQFGFILALTMFTSFGGFMFAVALTLQAGLGHSALESGYAFVAMGVSYFIGSLCSAKIANRLGKLNTLFLGCVLQIPALLALIWTFFQFWPNINAATLMPATLVMGVAQSFIVSSFYRIGLSEMPSKDAGAGSAMLTTVQQAAFGLGSALFGTIVYQVFYLTQSHQTAVIAALFLELALFSILAICGLVYRRRLHGI